MRLFCWSRAVVFSMARAPGCGLAALCLVSRRSVWYRGALLRGLSQCRCGCELVSPCESLASRVPVVPLPLRSKHSEQPWLSAIDLAPRGEDGMVASAEEAESSASSTSLDRPSAVLAIVSPPRGLSAGSRERKNPFRFFRFTIYQLRARDLVFVCSCFCCCFSF